MRSPAAVLVLAAAAFTVVVDETSIALLGPSVAADFGLGDQIRHLLVTPFAAAFIGTLPVAVMLFGRVDPRRAVAPAVCVFAGSAAAGALAPSVFALVGARLAQGAAAAVVMTCVLASLHVVTADSATRTRDFALFSVVSGAGAVAALLVAAPLATVSWRLCFWAVCAAALCCVVGWLVVRPESRAGRRSQPGAPGSSAPWRALSTASLVNAALSASVITVSFAAQQDHDWSPTETGIGFLPLNGAAAIGAAVVSRFSARLGQRFLLCGGIGLLAAGCALLGVVPQQPAAMLSATIPLGVGLGIALPLVNDGVLSGADSLPMHRAAALGVTQQIGLAIGALIAAIHSPVALCVLAACVALWAASAHASPSPRR
ncbi:MFS transporter [Gordonia sp. (in: high G+C Gram-positive bacteria)]|uniref:MFS transporter n=1 Tax=Gordonia sp. (in: high G+C Gram-positive bacteria) TaxID=84139 RepID=UPI00333F1079